MIDALTAPYGVLLLRWCLGAMFIAHAFWTAALLAVFLMGDGAATLVASPPLSGQP